ncbi:NAD(P)/FAD-dependent oxidoreductase [Tropicimonas marinistellae]|uniref:NAD(P)/FAD-dependent oxidoreductase n=1 Tax=Tropicimonas marinistellae TaxID=1739787 RepID=UPI0008358A2A|nr:FAD-dependent oxidoreductase [Tropicimonas marinistellae]
MPFDRAAAAPRRIAVVGGGISGMGAAHFLADHHRVVLFEGGARLGGHARTLVAGRHGDQPVDTGFIVFNRPNYPRLTALFDRLDVPVAPSDMTFAASIDGGRIEYGLRNIRTLFAQRRNLARPSFLRMIRDIVKFNSRAEAAVAMAPGATIGDLLRTLGTGRWFRDYYLSPLSGAIWSTPAREILDFPARAMVEFFRNHALLHHTGQHQWYTVRGGSVQYVSRLGRELARQGVETRLASPVAAVRRGPGYVDLRARGGDWERFDDVVFATHSNDTLGLLADPLPHEQAALAAIAFRPNDVTLHADSSVMPRRRACWSAWNYAEAPGKRCERIDLTYWMNALQGIPASDPLFVTLNSTRPIRDELIYDQTTMHHPVYNLAAFAAQEALAKRNGEARTWFCGAWMKSGFHEDGLASAADVADAILSESTLATAAQ